MSYQHELVHLVHSKLIQSSEVNLSQIVWKNCVAKDLDLFPSMGPTLFTVWKRNRKCLVAQSSPALCDPMDFSVHGILQARILEWVTIPFFRGSSQPRDQIQISCIASISLTIWATFYCGFFLMPTLLQQRASSGFSFAEVCIYHT